MLTPTRGSFVRPLALDAAAGQALTQREVLSDENQKCFADSSTFQRIYTLYVIWSEFYALDRFGDGSRQKQ